MKAKLFIPGLLALLMSFSLASASQEKLSIEQIIERHIQALGGQQKIDAIHTIVYHLTYREGTFVMPDGYMAKMRPYYKTLGDPKNLKVDVNEGYDGSAWEYYSDPGVVLRTVGAAAAARGPVAAPALEKCKQRTRPARICVVVLACRSAAEIPQAAAAVGTSLVFRGSLTGGGYFTRS